MNTFYKTFLVLILFTNLVSSQSYYHNHIDEKNGLASNMVNKIIQDKNGYLWFGTSSGISKFDGTNFTEYSTDNGLTDYDILSLYEDNEGRIWFETFNGKPCFYYEDKIFNPDNHELLSKIKFDKYIFNTYQDSQGLVWIGTSTETYSIDFKKNEVIHYPKINSSFFIENRHNELLIYQGIDSYFNVNENKLYRTKNYTQDEKYSRTGKGVLLNNGNIVFKTFQKTYLKKLDSDFFEELNLGLDIISIYSFENSVFFSTRKGVYEYDIYNFNKPKHVYLKNIATTSFIIDHQSNYWISSDIGAYHIFKNFKTNFDFSANASNLAVSKNYFLIGNTNGKLILYDKSNLSKITEYNINTNPNHISVNNDTFFIATNNSGFIINKNLKKQVFPNTTIKSLSINNDTIYASTSAGFFSIKNDKNIYNESKITNLRKNKSFKFYTQTRSFTHSIINNNIFFSSRNELMKITNNKIENLSFAKEAINNRISTIEYYHDILFLGTDTKGIYLFKNGKKINHFYEANGLLSNQVKNVFFKDNVYYIITKKGVQFIENNTLKNIDNISSRSLLINKAQIINSILFLATSEGLITLAEEYFFEGKKPIKSHIKVFNELTQIKNGDTLKHNQNQIEFNFKIFNYESQEEIYTYKIDGLDKNWLNTSSNTVQYKNIPSGHYNFQLKSNNNIINEFGFTIKHPYWEKPWFYIVSIFGFLTFSYLIYRIFINQKVKKERKKHSINLMLAKAEQDALKAQMNPHFIFNALNAIQNLILQNKTVKAHLYLGNFSKLVRMVLNNSRKLTVSIENEVKFLSLYLALEKLRFTNKLNYKIDIDSSINTEQEIPSMVIQPFVENAIIHGLIAAKTTNPQLIITFNEDNQFIYCKVLDNGIGRNFSTKKQKNTKNSLGLKITKERLLLYDNKGLSNFEIIDKKQGTLIVLKIRKNVKSDYS